MLTITEIIALSREAFVDAESLAALGLPAEPGPVAKAARALLEASGQECLHWGLRLRKEATDAHEDGCDLAESVRLIATADYITALLGPLSDTVRPVEPASGAGDVNTIPQAAGAGTGDVLGPGYSLEL